VARGNVIRDAINTALLGYLTGGAGAGKAEPPCNSFVPGTKVLMADGTTKAIEDVEPGDKVLASDPETGRTEVKTVTAEILGQGQKHLVRLTLTIETADGEQRTASLTATAGHLFWVAELGTWFEATDLTVGQRLKTSDKTVVRVTGIHRWDRTATVHNLTVADLHTYYVLAGATPVLVHNCGSGASDAMSGAKLKRFYSQGQKYGQAGIKVLENGRVRFYGKITPASNPGEMVGRRLVREWDPATDATRIWHETLDGAGNVRIVRPDVSVTGGKKVHYKFDSEGNFTGTF